jgi:hypothetical protein
MDGRTRRIRLIAAGAVVLLALASNGWWAGFARPAVVQAEAVAPAGATAAGALAPAQQNAAQFPPTGAQPTATGGGANVPGAGSLAGASAGTNQIPGQTAGVGTSQVPGQVPSQVAGVGSALAVGGAPLVGGVVQNQAGVPLQYYWGNVAPQYQYYKSPYDANGFDWYAERHINNPQQFQVFTFDPGPQCGTYYYQYQGLFYCYNAT